MLNSPIFTSTATVSSGPELTAALLRHERSLVAGSVLLLALTCWVYLWAAATAPSMSGMAGMTPTAPAVILMWWLMMGAMMLPSASPAVLLYARVRRASLEHGSGVPASWTFLAGYMTAWLLFSIAAAIVQLATATSGMLVGSHRLAGGVLIAVGAYQLSPLKRACLSRCRSPAEFFARHWRAGRYGGMRLGLLHGTYCVGCCWLLMALLFVGGVMNLALIALLTAAVSAEKLLPGGQRIAQVTGVSLIAGGIILTLI